MSKRRKKRRKWIGTVKKEGQNVSMRKEKQMERKTMERKPNGKKTNGGTECDFE